MKFKFIILSFLFVNVTDLFSQDDLDQKVIKLNQYCEAYNSLVNEKNSLISDIKVYKQELEECNNKWRELCEDYIKSDNQTKEDLEFLLRNTDKQKENELYEKLLYAKTHLKSSTSSRPPHSPKNPAALDKPKSPKEKVEKRSEGDGRKKKEIPRQGNTDTDYDNNILKGKLNK